MQQYANHDGIHANAISETAAAISGLHRSIFIIRLIVSPDYVSKYVFVSGCCSEGVAALVLVFYGFRMVWFPSCTAEYAAAMPRHLILEYAFDFSV
jgi:hypothetical protein